MQACPAIWNVLHDATVVAIAGSIPGTVRLTLECDYLRERIAHPGDRFIIALSNCSRLVYSPWTDDSSHISDLQALAERRLWILSAERRGTACAVQCNEHLPHGNGGVLEVVAAEVQVMLDDETLISQAELEAVAEEYWAEWQSSAKE